MSLDLTFSKLINGEKEIVDYYQNANRLWSKFWKNAENTTSFELSVLVNSFQSDFERECGGTSLAKEIMGWSGYIYLTSSKENWDISKIAKLDKAISNSMVSLEIKMYSENAVEFFKLKDEINEYLEENNYTN